VRRFVSTLPAECSPSTHSGTESFWMLSMNALAVGAEKLVTLGRARPSNSSAFTRRNMPPRASCTPPLIPRPFSASMM